MKRLIIMFALFAALAPAVALAVSLTNPIWDGRYPVTCNVGNAPCTFCDLLKVGANVVDTLTVLVIPIAAAIIVYGGFRIMTAGSSPTGLSAGKEAMKWAGIGIAVALSGWLIVNTVFSLLSGGTLTAIECPASEIITPVPYEPGESCDALKLTIPSHSWGGTGGIFNVGEFPSGFPIACDGATQQKVQTNLNTLWNEVRWLQQWIQANTTHTFNVNSAFRPASYQAHLYEVFTKYNKLSSFQGRCSVEVVKIRNEYSQHGLGSTVAEPGSSPHGHGYGVDLSIGGCGNGPNFREGCSSIYTMVKNVLKNKSRGLYWNKIDGDEVHFNLLAPVRNSGC